MSKRAAEGDELVLLPQELLEEFNKSEKSLTLLPDIPGICTTLKIEEAMTVTLKLKPEVEAWRGLAKAIREGSRGQGVDVDAMGSKPGRLTTTGWGPLRMTIQVTGSAGGVSFLGGRWAGMRNE